MYLIEIGRLSYYEVQRLASLCFVQCYYLRLGRFKSTRLELLS